MGWVYGNISWNRYYFWNRMCIYLLFKRSHVFRTGKEQSVFLYGAACLNNSYSHSTASVSYTHLLKEHKNRISEEKMKELALACERKSISFYEALAKPGLSIIGEFKKASPSMGKIKICLLYTSRCV